MFVGGECGKNAIHVQGVEVAVHLFLHGEIAQELQEWHGGIVNGLHIDLIAGLLFDASLGATHRKVVVYQHIVEMRILVPEEQDTQ